MLCQIALRYVALWNLLVQVTLESYIICAMLCLAIMFYYITLCYVMLYEL